MGVFRSDSWRFNADETRSSRFDSRDWHVRSFFVVVFGEKVGVFCCSASCWGARMPRLSSRCAVHSGFCFGAHAVASPPVWYLLYLLCCCCYSFGFLYFFCSCALLTKLDCVEKGGGGVGTETDKK